MNERIDLGEVFNGTLDVLMANQRAVLLFVGGMTVLGALLEWGISTPLAGLPGDFTLPPELQTAFGFGAGIGGLLAVVVALVANYLLWETILQNGGYLHREGGRRFFRFLGQMIVVSVLTGLGFLFLIVPGLLFGARWAAAPAFLIAERQGVFEAMGSSWEMVRGNSTNVIIAAILVGLGFIVVSVTIVAALGDGLIGIFVTQLFSNISTVLQVGLGMFLFRRLFGPSQAMRDVFA